MKVRVQGRAPSPFAGKIRSPTCSAVGQGGQGLAAGRLDLTDQGFGGILPDHPPTRTPVSLLYPRSRQLSPRVRVFIDWAGKRFAEAG